ncbi:MAG: trehalose-phosphatase [Candidatus Omnitrophica bacterium]|nr:trehalose-phosphatase [Candidatus Omnitrophota bacterium]
MRKAKYLFSKPEALRRSIKGKSLFLFLDYDGTLAPIAETPDGAATPENVKYLLRELSKIQDCRIAIVSGRALRDISKRIGLKGIIYVGNHGFEIKGPKIKFKSPVSPGYRKTLETIKARLEKALSSISGAFIEDKTFSLSVHYRLVDKKDVLTVKNEFYSTIFLYELRNSIQVKPGKMVLEVRPPVPWNKGKVVLWLLGRRLFAVRDRSVKVMPVYIGDDVTDEDAFKSLKNRGITIFVGKPGRTKAHFYLKNPAETARFLEIILENMKEDMPCRKKNT